MSSADAHSNRNARILLIEDDEDIACIVQEELSEAGFVVVIARTGKEGERLFKSGGFDLVLLDVIHPDASGMDLSKKFKEHTPPGDFVPIIIVSSLSHDEDKVRGLRYADDYMTKPFSCEELRARVEVMLRITKLQRELTVSSNQYRKLYENLPLMCVSLDSERNVSDCNAAFRKVCSLEYNQIIGMNIFDFFDPDFHIAVSSYLDDIQSGISAESSHTIVRMAECPDRDGSLVVDLAGVNVGDEEDGAGVIMTMQDVTRGMKLEEDQRIARRQLYRSAQMASIGTLASGVAHELNNPLTAVLGFSDALLHRIEANEEIEKEDLEQYLSIIHSETIRCRGIIENLLKFSRDSGPQMLDISLRGSLESAIALVQPRAQKRNITIEDGVTTDVVVRGDSQKLARAFLSVLTNCLDFCPDGAAIAVELDGRDDDSRYVGIRIVDDGPGIPQEVLPRIFDPFFTTKEVGKGLGLGLSVCHKVIEECEGTVDVKSDGEHGTTVILEIPKGKIEESDHE